MPFCCLMGWLDSERVDFTPLFSGLGLAHGCFCSLFLLLKVCPGDSWVIWCLDLISWVRKVFWSGVGVDVLQVVHASWSIDDLRVCADMSRHRMDCMSRPTFDWLAGRYLKQSLSIASIDMDCKSCFTIYLLMITSAMTSQPFQRFRAHWGLERVTISTDIPLVIYNPTPISVSTRNIPTIHTYPSHINSRYRTRRIVAPTRGLSAAASNWRWNRRPILSSGRCKTF